MEEQFSIREALISIMAASPRVDETNAIQIHREAVSLAGVYGWNLDALGDDIRNTERAQQILLQILPSIFD